MDSAGAGRLRPHRALSNLHQRLTRRHAGAIALALAGVGFGSAGGLGSAAHRAEAQSLWTDPVALFSTTGFVSQPVAVADPSGDVHLFFPHSEGLAPDGQTPGELMYRRLREGRWSPSLGVLAAPDGKSVQQPAIVLDERGFLHVVMLGSAAQDVFYSSAHVSRAGGAYGWSAPIKLSTTVAVSPDLAVAPDGVLHFVYSGGGTVRYRRSTDAGKLWSREITVAAVDGKRAIPSETKLAVDLRGRLHVTWTEGQAPTNWPPMGTFSARSVDGGETWSEPLRIAAENYALTNTIAVGADTLHRVWHGTVGASAERRHQWSSDGGETWTAARHFTGALKGGLTGFSRMAVDSSNTLHLVTSVNGATGSTEDVYHLSWDGGAWSPPALISDGVTGRRSVESPYLCISQGNRIHAFFEKDFQQIWYASRLLNSPQLPARRLPTAVAMPTAPAVTGAMTNPATPAPPSPELPADSAVVESGVGEPMRALAAGALTTGALVAALAARQALRH